MQFDDLAQAAEELRQLGLDAAHEILYGPRGFIGGLDIGEDFYPLWELCLPENQDAVGRRDFNFIKARRGPDWPSAPRQPASV